MKTGLVLEGGGMRGFFTIGVLDALLECGITFDYIVGVSAGACHALSYISGQYGRGLRINLDYAPDSRYLSIKNLVKTKSIFGMDFIFDEIPNKLDPFDFKALENSTVELKMGATNIETGKVKYFTKSDLDNKFSPLRASCSLPIVAKPIEINGKKYMDGGIGDPIPINRALLDGCDRLVVVLTRETEHKKTPEKFKTAYTKLYKNYPEFIRVISDRHLVYKNSQVKIKELEKNGNTVVISPLCEQINIKRFENNPKILKGLYDHGYTRCSEKICEIKSVLTDI